MTKQDIWDKLHMWDYKKTFKCSVCEHNVEYYLPLQTSCLFSNTDYIVMCGDCFGVQVNDKAQEKEDKQGLSEIQRWFNYD